MAAIIGNKKNGVIDPYRAIACACLVQAFRDLKRYRNDPLRAIESSIFLVCEGCEFASVGGLPVTERRWEELLVRIF